MTIPMQVKLTDVMKANLDSRFEDLSVVVLKEPPYGAGLDCISNSGTMGVVVLLFICFSVAVQVRVQVQAYGLGLRSRREGLGLKV
jgi:hypothetical protein